MTQRILVAEHEMIVAFDLCDTVEEAGYEVEGPHAGISDAMLAFQKEKPDLAILDVELKDGAVYPLAQKLIDENVPIIFHSDFESAAEVKSRFPDATTLPKPCPPSAMISAMHTVLDNS